MQNLLKRKLKAGDIAVGTTVNLGHPDVTEWLSKLGYDWLFIDTEHEPTSLETLQQMMQSMNGSACTPIVRPPANDPIMIHQVLDIGAYGIIAPMVSTKEEAENAVTACKYPPAGIRGFGPRRAAKFDPDYLETANDEILIVALIETAAAIKNIDEIFSVDGIDAGFIGYADLSLSMGLGLPPKWEDKRYSEALDRVVKSASKWGKITGLHTTLTDALPSIDWALDRGIRLISAGDVDTFIIQGGREALQKVREKADQR